LLSMSFCHPRDLHSFPTRRSSDLLEIVEALVALVLRALSDISRLHRVLPCAWCRPILATATRVERVPKPVAEKVERQHDDGDGRSEEHTSELQSLAYLVCRLLLEK